MSVGLLYTGHSLDMLKSMSDCSVQMCVIGLEQNADYNEIAAKRLRDAGLDCEIL